MGMTLLFRIRTAMQFLVSITLVPFPFRRDPAPVPRVDHLDSQT
jgi:hypothetical protein